MISMYLYQLLLRADYVLYVYACTSKSPETIEIVGTTNNFELFHSKMKGVFYKAHPNVYQFMEVLNNVKKITRDRMTKFNKKKTNILNNKKIAKVIKRFYIMKRKLVIKKL